MHGIGMSKAPMRLRVSYADQNESFAQHLPRTGTVQREMRDSEGGDPWLLLVLDQPFDLQVKIGEPFQFRLAHIDAFLVRSRWQGYDVGDRDDVSVHILVVERGKHPAGTEFDVHNFMHIAWGTCDRVVA